MASHHAVTFDDTNRCRRTRAGSEAARESRRTIAGSRWEVEAAAHGHFGPYTAPQPCARPASPPPTAREGWEPTHPDCECTLVEEHMARCAAFQATFDVVADDPADELAWAAATGGASVAEDLRSLESLLGQQEWKAAAFIGGSVLEVLLYGALTEREVAVRAFADRMLARPRGQQDDGCKWSAPLNSWGMYGLIVAAEALGIATHDTADAFNRARRVRNKIHGRAGEVSRAEAREVAAAVATMASVAREQEVRRG
jgi:hypothetical protein